MNLWQKLKTVYTSYDNTQENNEIALLPINDLPSFAYANVLRRPGARRFLPALYGNPTLSRHRLDCYCGMFHLQHTNGAYSNNIYTREIQTSNYLRIWPKMEFLCYNDYKYYMNDVTKKSKGNILCSHQILNSVVAILCKWKSFCM